MAGKGPRIIVCAATPSYADFSSTILHVTDTPDAEILLGGRSIDYIWTIRLP